MIPTTRSHYNPCFWTAHWNPEYYCRAADGSSQLPSVREQLVHVLSVKSAKIYTSTVENIHFDKHLGWAEISRAGAEGFIRRHHPDRYEEFLRDIEGVYPVYLDFEHLLTALESLDPYQVLITAARRGRIISKEEKAFLAVLLVFQLLRSHAIMNSMLEWHKEFRLPKFEHFVTLKWMLQDGDLLFRVVQPLMLSRWTFYATSLDKFPLCDSPVLIKRESILFALSPRLLLEIDRTVPAADHEWRHREGVPGSKLAAFRRRTIGNTFREIIFGDRAVLEEWKNAREFTQRVALIRDASNYNRLVDAAGGRELWQLNAYGNQ